MGIQQGLTASFKQQLLEAKHDFVTHTFKLALYKGSAELNHLTTDYTTTGECTGAGYTAGGIEVTVISPTTSGAVAFVDISDAVFSGVTLTARGALLYNTTTDGGTDTTDSVMVLDFGFDRSASGQDFEVVFPSADAANAIIRIE